MSCEEHRQRLSLMMDAEIEGMEQTGLFAHLEGCPGCRQFLDSLIRFRNAARRDREEILLQADELLPARPPLPAAPGRAAGVAGGPPGRWRGRVGAWLRPSLPAPMAIVLAVLLLALGIAIGAGLGARREAARIPPDAETARRPPAPPQVVYVCSMPEVEVTGDSIPTDPH